MTQSTPSPDLKDSAAQRQTMVDCQIRTFDVTDQRLIARVLAVPRERFVPDGMRDLAYTDTGITIPGGPDGAEPRYLLPPLILVRLIQGARVKATDRVLDVAGGYGYSAALLAGLAAEVHVLETGAGRCAEIAARLQGIAAAPVVTHAGALGAPVSGGPFDVILVNGCVETDLEPLFANLAEGGRLVCIRRSSDDPTGRAAKALCYEKQNGDVGTRYLFAASAPVLPAFKAPPAFEF
jgi:protein-L-isoaspartate(D-aspartate) O-methyltransferase